MLKLLAAESEVERCSIERHGIPPTVKRHEGGDDTMLRSMRLSAARETNMITNTAWRCFKVVS